MHLRGCESPVVPSWALCQAAAWGRRCPALRAVAGSAWQRPSTTLGADTARSGVTRNLHGCSLTWFEPMSAAGFASVQLSWFCFAAVIVFNSNAAEDKEVVALLLASRHRGWHSKAAGRLAPPIVRTLPCPQSSLSFLDGLFPHGSPVPRGKELLHSRPLLAFLQLQSKTMLPGLLILVPWTTLLSAQFSSGPGTPHGCLPAELVHACASRQCWYHHFGEFVLVTAWWTTSGCRDVGKRHLKRHKAAGTKIMSTSSLIHRYWESEFVRADFCTSGKRSKAAGTILLGGIRTGAPKPTRTGTPVSPLKNFWQRLEIQQTAFLLHLGFSRLLCAGHFTPGGRNLV